MGRIIEGGSIPLDKIYSSFDYYTLAAEGATDDEINSIYAGKHYIDADLVYFADEWLLWGIRDYETGHLDITTFCNVCDSIDCEHECPTGFLMAMKLFGLEN